MELIVSFHMFLNKFIGNNSFFKWQFVILYSLWWKNVKLNFQPILKRKMWYLSYLLIKTFNHVGYWMGYYIGLNRKWRHEHILIYDFILPVTIMMSQLKTVKFLLLCLSAVLDITFICILLTNIVRMIAWFFGLKFFLIQHFCNACI